MSIRTSHTELKLHRILLLFAAMTATILTGCKSSSEMVNETKDTSETATPEDSLSSPEEPEPEQDERSEQLTELYKQEIHKQYATKANRISNYYVLAQQRFYAAEYRTALRYINQALEIQDNAYLYALRGSIYLGLKERTRFVEDWKLALEMDENVPIPESDYIIAALQNYGLIDENLRKKF